VAIARVQLMGGAAPSKCGKAKKCSKIDRIYDNFWLWPRISLKKIKIRTSRKRRYQPHSLPRWTKKFMLFGLLMSEITQLLFTHPKSALRVLRMPMHCSSGHVTLLPGEFQPPKFSPNRSYGAEGTHVWLCPKFLVKVHRFVLNVTLAYIWLYCLTQL